jgi:pilus assembly protein CpaE
MTMHRNDPDLEAADLDLDLDMDAPLGRSFASAQHAAAEAEPSSERDGDDDEAAASPLRTDSAFVNQLLSLDEDEDEPVRPSGSGGQSARPSYESFWHEPSPDDDGLVSKPLLEDDLALIEDGDTAAAAAATTQTHRGPADRAAPVSAGAPRVEEPHPSPAQDLEELLSFDTPAAGGDRILPRITIHAFCVRSHLLAVMRNITRDRRMKNVMMEVHEGGIQAAIHHYASETTPNLLILEGSGDARRLLQELDALADYCDENIRVIVIGETNDIRLYRELMRRGVSEYLVAPVEAVSLIRTIGGLFSNPETPFVGRTLAVTGVKGGVGASSVAHNLAWALTERIKVNATLVDLDLNFGTTGLDFNQDPGATIADALMSPDRFDDAVMGRLVARATDRLSLFTAPGTLDRTYDLDPETYSYVLEKVRGSVPYVVLDLPHIWSDWFKTTIVGADEVVIVAAPDLASLRNGKNLVDFLKAARPNDAPPHLLLNMVGVPKRPEIPAKDFGQAIGLAPEFVLPFEPQVFGTAANNGQMIFDVASDSKCALAIDQLASKLTGKDIQAAKPSILKKILLGK